MDNYETVFWQVIGNPEASKVASPPVESDIYKQSFTHLDYVGLKRPEAGHMVCNIDTFKETLITMPVTKTGIFSMSLDNTVI